MNRPTNTALKIAGIALALSCLGGALTGCGGSDSGSDGDSDAASSASSDPTTDASTDSSDDADADATTDGFCEEFNGLYENVAGADSGDTAGTIKDIKKWAAGMEDYGTPSEMSDDERDGFEVVVSTFAGVDDDATAKDLQALGTDLSAKDAKTTEAFGAWMTKNCPSPTAPDAPSDDAS